MKTKYMALAAMIGLTGLVSAANFDINAHLGSFPGGSTDAVKANIDYDGAGPLPPGTYVIKPRTDGNDWYLPDIVFVEDGATLIIEAGTTIYADADNKNTVDKNDDTYGAIVVARGGKLLAEGTATKPIIITSVAERDGLPSNHPFAGQQPVPGRDGGLWGGLVLLGRAPLTTRESADGQIIREALIEGFAANTNDTRVLYGPGAGVAQPEDNSGVLSYMSLRFGGYEFSNGNEINGLTMGGVGRGTRIENIEVVSNTDDAFEWFGGTVNCRNLIAVFCNDDNMDIDLGYQGVIQNVLIVQNNVPQSQGADNAFELSGVTGSVNQGTGPNAADATRPYLFNVTAIGNGATNSTAFRINSGFSGQVHNSVFLNYDRGVRVDDVLTAGLVSPNGTLAIKNNTWVTPRLLTVASGAAQAPALALYEGSFGSGATNNEFATVAELGFRSASLPTSGVFNPTLDPSSPLWERNGATTTKAADMVGLLDSNQLAFLKELPYQGAFGTANWASGWTYLSEKGYFASQNFDILADLASYQGGSADAVKANVDYDGPGPLPAGTYVIKPRTDGRDWYLPDILFVEDGATLIIEAGTTIYADADNKNTVDKNDDTYGAIVVARGGKLLAEGTATKPIIITSVAERDGLPSNHPFAGQQPVPGRDGGLWGGVVLLGRAPLTTRESADGQIIREALIEGFAANTNDTRVLYGPGAGVAQPNDNSGVLSFMSLRFGGYEFSNGNEINGLTMGGVGRGTRIENIEVVSNTDDAFEWFGGTVNCRNLIAVFCNDDNMDIDLGYQGVIQNVLIVQNNVPQSQGADNAFELSGVTGSVNQGTGPNAADATRPFLFNVTAIGNGATNSTAFRINSGFSGQVHNSVFLNYDRGVRVDDVLTAGLVSPNGTLAIKNNTWVTPRLLTVASGAAQAPALALYEGSFGAGATNNEFDTIAELEFKSSTLPTSGRFNPTLKGTSPLWEGNGASMTKSADMTSLLDSNQLEYLEDLPYQGAFGNSNWADGWTYLSENGYFSQVASSGDSEAPVITLTGANPLVILEGATFTDPGATVTDNVDATRSITGTGSVNTSVPGTYVLTYNAVDAEGNVATTVTRNVIVLSTSSSFVTSTGNPLNIANFFQTGAFANATVVVDGRLPSGMTYNAASKTITRYPTGAGVARFRVTLPGQTPFIYTMNFAIQPVPVAFVGPHTLHTDEGDLVILQIGANANVTGSILAPSATRAVSLPRVPVRFDSSETDPNRQWTINIEALQLAVALPTVRELRVNDGSFLANYGTIAGKTLWGYRRSNTTGSIVMRQGNAVVTIVGTYAAQGSVTWRVTVPGARAPVVVATPAGTMSTDGILSIRTNVPSTNGPLRLMGMLRIEEQLNDSGVPTGQMSVSLLQGFDGWTLESFTPQ